MYALFSFNPTHNYVVFLVLELNKRGYRCYDPVAKRLKISCHVAFLERKNVLHFVQFHGFYFSNFQCGSFL